MPYYFDTNGLVPGDDGDAIDLDRSKPHIARILADRAKHVERFVPRRPSYANGAAAVPTRSGSSAPYYCPDGA